MNTEFVIQVPPPTQVVTEVVPTVPSAVSVSAEVNRVEVVPQIVVGEQGPIGPPGPPGESLSTQWSTTDW